MTGRPEVFVELACTLGEGPLWDHRRQQFIWFDIKSHLMFRADAAGRVLGERSFDTAAAAAALTGGTALAVIKRGAIVLLEHPHAAETALVAFEPDRPGNRPNDCRVHPAGGWWVSSMDDAEEEATGGVYVFGGGALTAIRDGVRIANSICFSPDGGIAYFTDTPTGRILKCPVDMGTGLPAGPWTLFADVTNQRGSPDGATVDSEGCLWSARWGGSSVVRHAPDGRVIETVELPVSNVSCPAFGGSDFRTLFVTTATKGMTDEQRAAQPLAGSVFAIATEIAGVPEPLLVL